MKRYAGLAGGFLDNLTALSPPCDVGLKHAMNSGIQSGYRVCKKALVVYLVCQLRVFQHLAALMNESQANQRPSGDKQKAKGPSVSVTACDQCYRCKVRCSGTQESCDRCLQNSSICTYSLGKPLGKPPKNGRGRAPKHNNQLPLAKRRRCSIDDAPVDASDLPVSPSPSSSGSGNGTGRKRHRRGELQELNPPVRKNILPLLPYFE